MKQLTKIQAELKCPKGSFNKFGGFKYRSAEQILESVKPILFKYESVLILSDEIFEVGSKLFLKATATLISSDGEIKVHGFAQLGEHKGMSSEQTTGTASSYARKYALNGLFLIDETESDPDSKDNTKNDEQKPSETKKTNTEKQTLSVAQFNKLIGMIRTGEPHEKHGVLTIEKSKSLWNLNEEQLLTLNDLQNEA
jgi:hypothetical protein